MNKRSKMVLIVLMTAALVLAVVLPALARKPIETDPNCRSTAVIVHKSGAYDYDWVYGALDAYWEDGVLYNYCTGIIPWGDETDMPGWRFATFIETCVHFGDRVTCEKNTAIITPDQWGNDVKIYDPETEDTYDTRVFYYSAHRNGEFLFNKEYTPEE